MARPKYHHGNLRAELIDVAGTIVAESGLSALSVAAAAKRTGVTAAAPYRHFSGRLALLTAVAAEAARQFDAEARAALPTERDDDPVGWAIEAMASTAATYVRFVVRRRIGWDVIFGDELKGVLDQDRLAAARSLSDTYLDPARVVTGGDVRAALTLVEHEIATAHGYATLYTAGLFARRYPDVERAARKAASITRTLATAAAGPEWAAAQK
ncbi:TetR/AcrR family transcriptional regulator [Mycobacterium sp. WMMD1722]|uniref:TetR/AcrR family transcriptional regulator n=1 Tax=Mycobacterium sp. WMMD1722 TaxID=3404117 RepID=UPI003BF5735B